MNRAADSRVLYKYVTRKHTENLRSFSPFVPSLILFLYFFLCFLLHSFSPLLLRLDSTSSHLQLLLVVSCTPLVCANFSTPSPVVEFCGRRDIPAFFSLSLSLCIFDNFSAYFLSALLLLFDNHCVCFERSASSAVFDNFCTYFLPRGSLSVNFGPFLPGFFSVVLFPFRLNIFR